MRANCWSSFRSASSVSARSSRSGARPRRSSRRSRTPPAPLHQVGEDAEHDEVADDHAHRGADERVDAAPVTPRLHVAADRAERGDPLQDDLPEEQDERPGDVVRVREERAVARVRPLLGLHAADGQDHVVRLPRKQVPATRAAVATRSPSPGEDGARSRRSPPERSTPSRCRAPSRPSGRPGCRRSSPAGSPPGSRRSGRRGRSPTRRSGATRPRASAPSSARSRRASPAGARASRDRRSRGRRFPGRPSRCVLRSAERCAG